MWYRRTYRRFIEWVSNHYFDSVFSWAATLNHWLRFIIRILLEVIILLIMGSLIQQRWVNTNDGHFLVCQDLSTILLIFAPLVQRVFVIFLAFKVNSSLELCVPKCLCRSIAWLLLPLLRRWLPSFSDRYCINKVSKCCLALLSFLPLLLNHLYGIRWLSPVGV